ncbi:L-type lectin-domain containing receptor kinase IX.1-like [Zingiber officinale]|uniref:Protein kinase domain-containing protein n=1 Tax=Zingiber officinale TaxID=94328 RepID=A0A8J5FN91_ZINOF|nr:L-type lectin-domain containing receptor kinase IX.1-like [Zingiber officinale]KAG6488376.1 hypothetical protein ZIOFF_049619 [Zingiber officinale]
MPVLGLIARVIRLIIFILTRPICCLIRRLLGSFTQSSIWKRWINGEKDTSDSLDQDVELALSAGVPGRLCYKDLVSATSNFSDKQKLGQGGFGCVYRGLLSSSKQQVAVKKISSNSKQGIKEYLSEIKIISRLRHRNLVQLVGWCHERSEFILVYEFLPNRSLDWHLFPMKKNSCSLTWEVRYSIALGLASALLYLHEEADQCVVHRDVKSSNVMLDSDFNAKLGDFGLARLVDREVGLKSTAVAGTFGYLAPECFATGKASKESDVFSFGVVALEIAAGRRAVEPSKDDEEVRLVDWVWRMHGEGTLLEAVDRSLGEAFGGKQAECLMLVGLWCVHPDREQRPSMRQVVLALNFEGPVAEIPREIPVPVFVRPPTQDPNFSIPTITDANLITGR